MRKQSRKQNPLDPYDTFLNTGKISDYLNYVSHSRGVSAAGQGTEMLTGEASAYQDTGDRPASADG